VRTHVALLRGVNVGGHGRIAMADLRGIVESLGHRDVATYVQSGNVVLTAADDHAEPAALASALGRAIAAGSDVRPDVVVLTRDALARVVANNPYADEDDPKHVHVAFQQGGADDGAAEATAAAVERARAKGSRDEGSVVDGVLYLHTPDGLGRSELAAQLTRRSVTTALGGPATMRNWATVTKLLALLHED
jgi:uncharacterized protein (DUF1697 family)